MDLAVASSVRNRCRRLRRLDALAHEFPRFRARSRSPFTWGYMLSPAAPASSAGLLRRLPVHACCAGFLPAPLPAQDYFAGFQRRPAESTCAGSLLRRLPARAGGAGFLPALAT
jgi:hypothetical protein